MQSHYILNPSLKGKQLINVLHGKAVALGTSKPITKTVKKNGVIKEIEIPPATQSDLKAIHEAGAKLANGEHLIYKVETKSASAKSATDTSKSGK